MRYPTYRKTGENGKGVNRSNLDDREQLIAELGEDYFYSHNEYEYLYDLKCPKCFIYVFNVYMELYNMCHENITWNDIDCYSRIRNVKLKQVEIDYIMKINSWANHEINQLRKNGD